MGFATPRTGLAAVDGCFLAALHWEEHSVNPTVLENSLDLVMGDISALMRVHSILFVAARKAVAMAGGVTVRSRHGVLPWLTNGWNAGARLAGPMRECWLRHDVPRPPTA